MLIGLIWGVCVLVLGLFRFVWGEVIESVVLFLFMNVFIDE